MELVEDDLFLGASSLTALLICDIRGNSNFDEEMIYKNRNVNM